MSNHLQNIRAARARSRGQPAPMPLPRMPGVICGLRSPSGFNHSSAATRNVAIARAGIAPELTRLDERIIAESEAHLGESARARAEGRAR
jgi:hypothetical protein